MESQSPTSPEIRGPVRNGNSNAKPLSVPGVVFFGVGVVFPLLVIILEFSTGMCASTFFDPMPSVWHVVLVSLVPLSNLLVAWAVRKHVTGSLLWIRTANGIAMIVGGYYTLLFAPMLPLALIASIYGIGILPMAPLCSFIMAVRGCFYLRPMPDASPSRVPGTLVGLVAGMLAMTALDLPAALTRLHMKGAISSSAEKRASSIQWLRRIGDEAFLLRACYQRTGFTDPLSMFVNMGKPIQPHQAREIFYRVTGKAFNAVPPPANRPTGLPYLRMNTFDADLGGQGVGGRIEGVELAASRIDGSMDNDAALAYVEWTMEFVNHTARQQEARAQLALPPGGVVSRLTLWVNGEEREAAFAERSRVRAAYEKIVRKQRDPVLVTTSGPDRVLVQCFPVPPNGGTMKLRLGITAPLIVQEKSQGLLRLPSIVERNYHIPDARKHQVWIEAKNGLSSPAKELTQERPSAELYALRGELPDSLLSEPRSFVEGRRAQDLLVSWTQDKVAEDGGSVVQTVEERAVTAPSRVVLVVDASKPLAPSAAEIADALGGLPSEIPVSVFLAADQVMQLGQGEQRGTSQEIVTGLRAFPFQGGQDNVPALVKAWDVGSLQAGAAIVWIHGSQPIILESPSTLRQRWERRPGALQLYAVAAAPGPNRVSEELDGLPGVKRVPRLGTLREDLERLFASWKPGARSIVLQRNRVAAEQSFDREHAKETSSHLVRLWANDQVMLLSVSHNEANRKQGVELAARYHLVTPVSGAVVLETAADFKAEGLTPAEAARAPTIPEPETWLLMITAAAALLWLIRRRSHPCEA